MQIDPAGPVDPTGAADATASAPHEALTAQAVDPALFKAAFRHHPAGVVIVTVAGVDRPTGFTATSLASVSLDPPLLSFAIAHKSSSWAAVRDASSFVVNFLAVDQHMTATTFATSGIDRFAPPMAWRWLDSGEPALEGTPAWVRCVVTHRLAVGDHDIVVGLVTAAYVRDETVPLVYHDRRYHGLGAHLPVA